MMRWFAVLFLVAAVLATAIGLIVLKHESRQQFTALQQAGHARDTEQVEWSRLQLELAWLGEAGRIERQAADQLEMKSPEQSGVLVKRP